MTKRVNEAELNGLHQDLQRAAAKLVNAEVRHTRTKAEAEDAAADLSEAQGAHDKLKSKHVELTAEFHRQRREARDPNVAKPAEEPPEPPRIVLGRIDAAHPIVSWDRLTPDELRGLLRVTVKDTGEYLGYMLRDGRHVVSVPPFVSAFSDLASAYQEFVAPTAWRTYEPDNSAQGGFRETTFDNAPQPRPLTPKGEADQRTKERLNLDDDPRENGRIPASPAPNGSAGATGTTTEATLTSGEAVKHASVVVDHFKTENFDDLTREQKAALVRQPTMFGQKWRTLEGRGVQGVPDDFDPAQFREGDKPEQIDGLALTGNGSPLDYDALSAAERLGASEVTTSDDRKEGRMRFFLADGREAFRDFPPF